MSHSIIAFIKMIKDSAKSTKKGDSSLALVLHVI